MFPWNLQPSSLPNITKYPLHSWMGNIKNSKNARVFVGKMGTERGWIQQMNCNDWLLGYKNWRPEIKRSMNLKGVPPNILNEVMLVCTIGGRSNLHSLLQSSVFIQFCTFHFLPHSYPSGLVFCVSLAMLWILQDQQADEQHGSEDMGPLILSAFDLIILSQGLNLSAMFNRGQVCLCLMLFAFIDYV